MRGDPDTLFSPAESFTEGIAKHKGKSSVSMTCLCVPCHSAEFLRTGSFTVRVVRGHSRESCR